MYVQRMVEVGCNHSSQMAAVLLTMAVLINVLLTGVIVYTSMAGSSLLASIYPGLTTLL